MAKSAAPERATEEKHRLDKWLWAARFFKTRALASQAVEGGKVVVNGDRVKPAKSVKVRDELVIRAGWSQYTIHVLALSDKRGPASEAAKLYVETEESIAQREKQAALRRANPIPVFTSKGRPTKRDRRKIRKFFEQDE